MCSSDLKNHQVYSPGHSMLDLTNPQSVDHFFETHEIDTVIHCALAGRDRINAVDSALAVQNLDMFNNLWRNRHCFKTFINMGTGNEFDTSTNIELAKEEEFFQHLPKASYGYAKNLIARIIHSTPSFFNLRLFGVFHHTESNKRFFKRLLNATDDAPFCIYQDHYFDFLNLEDLVPVIDAILDKRVNDFDFNLVYHEKYLLSELATMFAEIHGIPQKRIIIENTGSNHFTGESERYYSYPFAKQGLVAGFKKYQSSL